MGWTKVPMLYCFLAIIQSVTASSLPIHESDSTKYEPMVAFLCNKPSMHRVPEGWMQDDAQNCTSEATDILNYCKKKYPSHDITNVVTSHSEVTIQNWCKVGTEKCHRHNNHTVRPWRCLSGAFQSAALLVPEHCMFDHFHNTSRCEDETYWNQTAVKRCMNRGQLQQSYDILLPCEGQADRFQGVEYVCCPHPSKPKVTIDVEVTHHGDKKAPTLNVISNEDRPYFRYLHDQIHNDNTEHENYELARKDMQKYHHSKITSLMTEWSQARDRVVALKKSDPNNAETLNQEIGKKYQQMYQALEEDNMAEKLQLNHLHQNHVQKNYNELKRKAMQAYMDELQKEKPTADDLYDALVRYLRVEEKDRRHTVNHYEHMRDNNPAEADRILSATIDHLKWINKRIVQSLVMLHRFPEIERELKPDIDDFLLRFKAIAASAKVIMTSDVKIEDEQRQAVEDFNKDKTKKKAKIAPPAKPVEQKPPATENNEIKQAPEPSKAEDQDGAGKPRVEISIEKIEPAEAPHPVYDPETMENEHDLEKPKDFAAHQTDSRLHQDEFSVRRSVVHSSSAFGATIGIAVGSVSVFGLIIVAMVVMKRRAARKPMITHGFVEVDTNISPEERHVANMQINGYENPTYKYFEK